MIPAMERATTKEHMSVRLNIQLLNRLDAQVKKLGRTRSELVDRAIEEYVQRLEAEQKKARK
jgi:metal-responsive CopG/Arc/MetJ family transcriptional regulator